MAILQTVKRYATLIKWGGIIVLVSAILYAVYDYSQSKERLDQMETENTNLESRINRVKDSIDLQNKQIGEIRQTYSEIEALYSRQVEAINDLRSLTDQYIIENQPAVEQELNTKFDTLQQQILCVSGDKSKCAKE